MQESFGAPFAAPQGRGGLRGRALRVAGARGTSKLDIPDDYDPVAGAAGYPIETADHASGEQVAVAISFNTS